MSSPVQLPAGYRFRSSKPEIFSSFLIPIVVHGALIPPNFLDLEIYGENTEPWKHSRESFWVFTTLRKRDSSRSHRKAGSGTWRPWGLTSKVLDKQSQVLGFQKKFTFYFTTDQPANQDNGHWIMHEYSLNHENFKYRVICEI
ncbi:NAC domain containing protein 32 [Hibiscus trionum]|uniref:NAC domain containing protein 32 n=1 Tax=Hibiscus trionum TaxID=183268 RepID=A0A9W7IW77_HIBTR|nr:NAC domain containing protein 32 [Hibiscus trionum]